MSESERTFQIAQRVHRAFVESTMADARRDRLIGEYARAARAWQARGQSLGLEVAMQRSGLDARIRESWLDAVAFDFFRAVVTELQPLLETQLALRLAGLVGIEPWVVIALREREAGVLPRHPACACSLGSGAPLFALESRIDLGRSRRSGVGRPRAWPVRSGPIFVGLAAALAPARSHPASVWARRPGNGRVCLRLCTESRRARDLGLLLGATLVGRHGILESGGDTRGGRAIGR